MIINGKIYKLKSFSLPKMMQSNIRKKKTKSMEEVIKDIRNAKFVAIGGLSYVNVPCAFVREMVKRKVVIDKLYPGIVGGYPVELLLGSGIVKKIICPYVGYEDLGLSPTFRKAVENGKVDVIEVGEDFIGFGLKAGAAGIPFVPINKGHEGSQVVEVNPYYKRVKSPYDGEEYVTIPAINPDVAIIHVQKADVFGNGIHLGPVFTDVLLAKASKKVVISCDELVPHEEIRKEPKNVTIPSIFVDAVINIPYGAHPTESPFMYERDEDHLKELLNIAKSDEGFKKYLDKYVFLKDNDEYLEVIGKERLENLKV